MFQNWGPKENAAVQLHCSEGCWSNANPVLSPVHGKIVNKASKETRLQEERMSDGSGALHKPLVLAKMLLLSEDRWILPP